MCCFRLNRTKILLQRAKRTLAMRAAGVEGLEKAAAEAAVAITRAAVNLMVGAVMDGSKLATDDTDRASLPATVLDALIT